jgi:glycosyltransferase involved in cell wall biosynthesis
MKKKIVIDATNIKSTGGIVHLNGILKNYRNRNCKNILILINKKAYKELEIDKYSIKPTFYFNQAFEKNFIISFFWQIVFLNYFLKKNKCTHFISLNGYVFTNFKKTILLSQNALPFLANKDLTFNNKIKLFFQKMVHIHCIQKFKNVIYVSKFQKKIVSDKLQKKSIRSEIIYHGVDHKIKYRNHSKKEITNFLYVSQMNSYKNQNSLFKVFELFKQKSIKINLDCYGDNLINKKNKCSNIKIFKSFKKKNIDKIYSKYDAFIFPSLTESFGLPLIEAARAGLPICSSNIEIFKELLNKKNLILFNPNNQKDIYNKILHLSRLKRKKLRIMTKSNFKKSLKYNWQETSKKFFDFILSI